MPKQTMQSAIEAYFTDKSIKERIHILEQLNQDRQALIGQHLRGVSEPKSVITEVNKVTKSDTDLSNFMEHMITHFFQENPQGLDAYNNSIRIGFFGGRSRLEDALEEELKQAVRNKIQPDHYYLQVGSKLETGRKYSTTNGSLLQGTEFDEIQYRSGEVYGVCNAIVPNQPDEEVVLADRDGMRDGFTAKNIQDHDEKTTAENAYQTTLDDLAEDRDELMERRGELIHQYGSECVEPIDAIIRQQEKAARTEYSPKAVQKALGLQRAVRNLLQNVETKTFDADMEESMRTMVNALQGRSALLVRLSEGKAYEKSKFTQNEIKAAVPQGNDFIYQLIIKKLDGLTYPASIQSVVSAVNTGLMAKFTSEKMHDARKEERNWFFRGQGVAAMSQETQEDIEDCILEYSGEESDIQRKIDAFTDSMNNYMSVQDSSPARYQALSNIVNLQDASLEAIKKMGLHGDNTVYSTEHDVAFHFANLPANIREAITTMMGDADRRRPYTFFNDRIDSLRNMVRNDSLAAIYADMYMGDPSGLIDQINELVETSKPQSEEAYDFYITQLRNMKGSLDLLKDEGFQELIIQTPERTRGLDPDRLLLAGCFKESIQGMFNDFDRFNEQQKKDAIKDYMNQQISDLDLTIDSLTLAQERISLNKAQLESLEEIKKPVALGKDGKLSYFPDVKPQVATTPLLSQSFSTLQESLVSDLARFENEVDEQATDLQRLFNKMGTDKNFKAYHSEINAIYRRMFIFEPIARAKYQSDLTDLDMRLFTYDDIIKKLEDLIASVQPSSTLAPQSPSSDLVQDYLEDTGSTDPKVKEKLIAFSEKAIQYVQGLKSRANLKESIQLIQNTKESAAETEHSLSDGIKSLREALLSTGTNSEKFKGIMQELNALEEIGTYEQHLDNDSGMDFVDPSMKSASDNITGAIDAIDEVLKSATSSHVRQSMEKQKKQLTRVKKLTDVFVQSKDKYKDEAEKAQKSFKGLFEQAKTQPNKDNTLINQQQQFLFVCAKYLSGINDEGGSFQKVESDLEDRYYAINAQIVASGQSSDRSVTIRGKTTAPRSTQSIPEELKPYQDLMSQVKKVVEYRKRALESYEKACKQGNATDDSLAESMTKYQESQLLESFKDLSDKVNRRRRTEYKEFSSDKNIRFSQGLDRPYPKALAQSLRETQKSLKESRKSMKAGNTAVNKILKGLAYKVRQDALEGEKPNLDFAAKQLKGFREAALTAKGTTGKLKTFVEELKSNPDYAALKAGETRPALKTAVDGLTEEQAQEQFKKYGYNTRLFVKSVISDEDLMASYTWDRGPKQRFKDITRDTLEAYAKNIRTRLLKKIEGAYRFPLKKQDMLAGGIINKDSYEHKVTEYNEAKTRYEGALESRKETIELLRANKKPYGGHYTNASEQQIIRAWEALNEIKRTSGFNSLTLDQLQVYICTNDEAAKITGIDELRDVLGLPLFVNGKFEASKDYVKNLYLDLEAAQGVLTECARLGKSKSQKELTEVDGSVLEEPKDLFSTVFDTKDDSVLTLLDQYMHSKSAQPGIKEQLCSFGEMVCDWAGTGYSKMMSRVTTPAQTKIQNLVTEIEAQVDNLVDEGIQDPGVLAINQAIVDNFVLFGESYEYQNQAKAIVDAVKANPVGGSIKGTLPPAVATLKKYVEELNKILEGVLAKDKEAQSTAEEKEIKSESKSAQEGRHQATKDAYKDSAEKQIFDPLFRAEGFDMLMRVNGSKGLKKGIDGISPVVKEWAAETKQPIDAGAKRSLSTRLEEIMKTAKPGEMLKVYDDLPKPLRIKLQSNQELRDKFKTTLTGLYHSIDLEGGISQHLAEFYTDTLDVDIPSLSKDEVAFYLKNGESFSEKADFDTAMANLVDAKAKSVTVGDKVKENVETAFNALKAKCNARGVVVGVTFATGNEDLDPWKLYDTISKIYRVTEDNPILDKLLRACHSYSQIDSANQTAQAQFKTEMNKYFADEILKMLDEDAILGDPNMELYKDKDGVSLSEGAIAPDNNAVKEALKKMAKGMKKGSLDYSPLDKLIIAANAEKDAQVEADRIARIKDLEGLEPDDFKRLNSKIQVESCKELRDHLVSQYAKRSSIPLPRKDRKDTTVRNRLKGVEAAKYDQTVLENIVINERNAGDVGEALIMALRDDKVGLHRKHRDYWVTQIERAAADSKESTFDQDLKDLGFESAFRSSGNEAMDEKILEVLEKLKEFEDAMEYRGTNDLRTKASDLRTKVSDKFSSESSESRDDKYARISREVQGVRTSIFAKLENGIDENQFDLLNASLEKAIKDCKGGIRRTSRDDIIDALKNNINPPSGNAPSA
ncbi:MAG: hypothetical protein VX737_05630 [Pseudomonadota bacterium]|nr:hypothetical protein [Pseudomonadota bacterium]